MTRDLQALIDLPEAQLRQSFSGSAHADTVLALVLELRKQNHTRGERAANAIWRDLMTQSAVTITWNAPQVADTIRRWAGMIEEEVARASK